ncbi:MAG TPA: DNA-3-methyladenine glycosylase [Acidisarcina sp.]|nr:DNA-3-methyladenine glycosylase [Acidisarcina sp.]
MNDGRRPVRYNASLACEQLAQADPRLGRLIAQAGPFTLRTKSSHSPFEALLESIVYQQLHGKAAAAILRRLLTIFGEIHPQPEQIVAVPDELLRAAGLSAAKTLAIRDLAAKTLDGTVPTLAQIRRLSDAEIVERLTEVRGIGPWTVEMLLIFRLGRPDVLPVSDYGVRRGFALTFGKLPKGEKTVTAAMLPTPAEMEKRGKRWKPWRSVASWYLWRACDLADGTMIPS